MQAEDAFELALLCLLGCLLLADNLEIMQCNRPYLYLSDSQQDTNELFLDANHTTLEVPWSP